MQGQGPNDGGDFDIRNIQRRQDQGPARAAGGAGGLDPRLRAAAAGGGGQRADGRPAPSGCMAYIQDNPKVIAGCGLCIPILILIVVLLSLGSVGPIQYGLEYNRFSKAVSSTRAVKGGRHWIWPWGSFIVFPAQTIKIEFSERVGHTEGRLVNCRTQDSLSLTLSIAFQYQIRQDDIQALYHETGLQYQALYIRYAKQSICSTTTHFDGPAYYLDRKKIQRRMLADMRSNLEPYHADVTSLQLLKIDLPEVWEEAIVQTQVAKQQALTAENEQIATTVRSDIGVMVAGFQNQITVIRATAAANATVTVRNSQALALSAKIEAEKDAIQGIQATFQPPLSVPALVEYQKFFTMHQLPNATFLFGVPQAGVWIRPADPAPSPAASHQGTLHATECKA